MIKFVLIAHTLRINSIADILAAIYDIYCFIYKHFSKDNE